MLTAITLLTPEAVATQGLVAGARWVDLAAFAALAVVWLIIGSIVLALAKIIRSQATSPAEWGEGPGL